jgi:hypothetical protein
VTISFNDQYLNLTVNKDTRVPGTPFLLRCWHETGNGSGDPHSTLKWNLKAFQVINGKTYTVLSSYDFLIARDGEIFRYVDYHRYTSWSEGASRWTLDGTTYHNYALGTIALGIELDGANDGKQHATDDQLAAAARLSMFLWQTEGIALDGSHDVTHAQIAPGRKFDPRGYTIAQVLERARALLTPQDIPVGRYRVSVPVARTRERPDTGSAEKRRDVRGTLVEIDYVDLGTPHQGDPVWLRRSDGAGWMHRSVVTFDG